MEKRMVSWKETETACRFLAGKLRKNGYDAVVCIASGGLVPGKLFSGLLGLPLGIVAAKRYSKSNRADSQIFLDARIKWCAPDVHPKKILLVDDLMDEGKTVQSVLRGLARQKSGPKTIIDVAVLFYKERNVSVDLKPGRIFYYKKARNWLVFPWEPEP